MTLPTRLGLDTTCVLYLLEAPSSRRRAFVETAVFDAPGRSAIVSAVGLSEFMVRLFRVASAERVADARAAFEALPGMTIWPVDADVTREAIRIRAEIGCRMPDAIHIATALVAGADAFLTNDARLADRRAGLPILVLEELMRDE